LRCCAT
jgi:hypothetical protein